MGPLTIFAVAVAALYVPLVAADTPDSLPSITSVQYSGNGCPNDARRSGNFGNPTFTYSQFAASLPGTNKTVNCEIHVQAAGGSSGWKVALKDVNIDGHLVLDQGTRLDYFTTVYYSENADSTSTARQHISNTGGGTLDYPVSFQQSIARPVWSDCIGDDGSPGILNVNFRGALTGSGHAYFEVFTENWDFIWKRC